MRFILGQYVSVFIKMAQLVCLLNLGLHKNNLATHRAINLYR